MFTDDLCGLWIAVIGSSVLEELALSARRSMGGAYRQRFLRGSLWSGADCFGCFASGFAMGSDSKDMLPSALRHVATGRGGAGRQGGALDRGQSLAYPFEV
jgi:hypothetical protein